jgi:arginyl-tRNA synthetase
VDNNNFYKQRDRLNCRFKAEFLSIQKLILNYLEVVINENLLNKLVRNTTYSLKQTSIAQIKLHRFQSNSNIIYRCAIAHQLASIVSLSPLEVAQQLIIPASAIAPNFPEQLARIITIEISPPGWIDFCLDELFLANWLQKLTNYSTPPLPRYCKGEWRFAPAPTPFHLQYVHARCCSLLRSGEQVKLIQLNDRDFTQAVWQIQKPSPISWLDEKNKFLLVHPVEMYLIEKLLAAMDVICDRQVNETLKPALLLSEALLNFWDNCRIFGDAIATTPQLAQARLALVAATQLLLKILIEEHIGTSALIQM